MIDPNRPTTAKSQCAALLEVFRGGGSITSLEAVTVIGSVCLPRRIKDLREVGHDIQSVVEKGNGKRWVRYFDALYAEFYTTPSTE
jgi:hypothetical protein